MPWPSRADVGATRFQHLRSHRKGVPLPSGRIDRQRSRSSLWRAASSGSCLMDTMTFGDRPWFAGCCQRTEQDAPCSQLSSTTDESSGSRFRSVFEIVQRISRRQLVLCQGTRDLASIGQGGRRGIGAVIGVNPDYRRLRTGGLRCVRRFACLMQSPPTCRAPRLNPSPIPQKGGCQRALVACHP